MATIAQNLQTLIDTKNDIKDAIEEKGVDLTNIPFTDYHLKIAEIQSGGGEIVDTAINILIGHTLPIATKNGGETFFLEHASGVRITGLDNYATITGNGTQRVEWSLMENGDTDLIIPYVITLGNGDNVIGRQFYYGKETSDWVVLATLYRPNTGEAGNFIDNWVLIESSSEPIFSSKKTLYNGVYSHQVVSVRASKTATSVGDYFLSYCYSFNQPLDTSNITSVGYYFLAYCYSFNQPLDTSNLTSVGDNFLYNCYSFNQPLDTSNLTSVGYNFLYYCYSFNQPLDISNLTSVGSSFLNYCYSFNQPLDISNLTSVGDDFLNYCYSFNQPLDISNITSVGYNFLYYCYSFNQPLDTSNLTSVGSSFLNNCYALTDLEWNCSVYPTDKNSLSQDINTKTLANGTGIKITGTNAQGLINALPDRTSSPYRKLILGGE